MAKFADVVAGPRARKGIKLPLPGAQVDPATGEWDGDTVDLDVRAIGDDEYADVLRGAREFAKSKGVDNPAEDDELYERGKMLHTLAIACIDKDSPKEKPEPFFEGWRQIHESPRMIPEVVAYLYLQQRLWQDEINPLLKPLSPDQYTAAAIATAGGDMSFFVNSRPGTQWSFTRFLAAQLLLSLASSSPSSESYDPPSTTNH